MEMEAVVVIMGGSIDGWWFQDLTNMGYPIKAGLWPYCSYSPTFQVGLSESMLYHSQSWCSMDYHTGFNLFKIMINISSFGMMLQGLLTFLVICSHHVWFCPIFPYFNGQKHVEADLDRARRETNVGKLAGSIARRLRKENVAMARNLGRKGGFVNHSVSHLSFCG